MGNVRRETDPPPRATTTEDIQRYIGIPRMTSDWPSLSLPRRRTWLIVSCQVPWFPAGPSTPPKGLEDSETRQGLLRDPGFTGVAHALSRGLHTHLTPRAGKVCTIQSRSEPPAAPGKAACGMSACPPSSSSASEPAKRSGTGPVRPPAAAAAPASTGPGCVRARGAARRPCRAPLPCAVRTALRKHQPRVARMTCPLSRIWQIICRPCRGPFTRIRGWGTNLQNHLRGG